MAAGKDWHKEVGKWQGERQAPAPHVKHEKREQFYKDRVRYKLQQEFKDVIKNLPKSGYKTLAEHASVGSFKHEVKDGDRLFDILKKYYKNKFKLSSEQAEKETYISLAYVMHQTPPGKKTPIGNVDDLEPGWTVTINKGYLEIQMKNGKSTMDSTPMRPPEALKEKVKKPVAKKAKNKPRTKLKTKPKKKTEAPKEEVEEAKESQSANEFIKKEFKGFPGKVEVLENHYGVYGFKVLSDNAPDVEVLKDNSGKWILDGNPKLSYLRPIEAARDAKILQRAEALWSKYSTNVPMGAPPFYISESPSWLRKVIPGMNLSQQIPGQIYFSQAYFDSPILANIEADEEVLLEHINSQFYEKQKPKNVTPKSDEKLKSSDVQARNELIEELSTIALDITYEVLNASEVVLKRPGAPDMHLRYDYDKMPVINPFTASTKLKKGAWIIDDTVLAYSNIKDAAIDAEYVQRVEHETNDLKQGSLTYNPFYVNRYSNGISFNSWSGIDLFDVNFPRKKETPVALMIIAAVLNTRRKKSQ